MNQKILSAFSNEMQKMAEYSVESQPPMRFGSPSKTKPIFTGPIRRARNIQKIKQYQAAEKK
jgi:hypothetical protein